MWAPAAQLLLWPTIPLSLPKWATSEELDSVSQGCNRGNVMIVGPPTSFSLFSQADCTLLTHFSFNDFIMLAFPDLADDLDPLFPLPFSSGHNSSPYCLL